MYGKLEVICGPMFAGKTTEILKRILWAKSGENKKILVLKPSFDNRYSETTIVSHDGLKASALSINTWPSYEKPETYDVVFIDEIQFFLEPHFTGNIVQHVKELLELGKTVVVSGLDSDWQGNGFAITGQFLAIADQVTKLRANCTVCGKPATKNLKKTQSGGAIELGAQDLYEARCNDHWRE